MADVRMFVGSVHHVAFRVDDLDASLEFYQGLLGCERLPRPEDLPGARGAWMRAGSSQVHLTETPVDSGTGTPPSAIVPVACHVAFHTDDLDAVEASLRQRGIAFHRGEHGVEQIFIQDPSGNLIEFSPY